MSDPIYSADNLANINGGTGYDVAVFTGTSGFTFNLNLTNGFESAVGSEGNDNISVQAYYVQPQYWHGAPTGNYANVPLLQSYILSGDAGNDVLTAGVSADVLEGGAGNDTLKGEAGGDVMIAIGSTDMVDGWARLAANDKEWRVTA